MRAASQKCACRYPGKSASRSEQDGPSLWPDLQVARVVKRIKGQPMSSTSPKCDLGGTPETADQTCRPWVLCCVLCCCCCRLVVALRSSVNAIEVGIGLAWAPPICCYILLRAVNHGPPKQVWRKNTKVQYIDCCNQLTSTFQSKSLAIQESRRLGYLHLGRSRVVYL